jgi:glycosyltransferase involved in cell wall biosynthesis
MNNKISAFIPNLRGGGAERVTVYLVNGLVERGLNVDLILGQVIGPHLANLSEKVRVVELNARRILTGILPLAKYLRSESPAILLTALEHATIAAFVAKRIAGVRTRMVPTAHSTLSQIAKINRGIRDKVINHTIARCYRRSDAVVAVSQGTADDMVQNMGVPPGIVRVIYPILTPNIPEIARGPVDHPWFAPDQPGVILAAGSLRPQKDFTTLLKAFARVVSQVPHRLMILGEGVQRSELEQLVRKLKLTDRVAMPGYSTNIFAYMARCSLFVLSSSWEAMPMVLTEALAAGAPAVATNCMCGPREILQNGKYGLLVPVGDVEQLAKAMLETLAAPRRQPPEDAFRPFSTATVVDQHCKLFEELLNA